eukprot:360234-Chlamydomonas_euryale.AAC.1
MYALFTPSEIDPLKLSTSVFRSDLPERLWKPTVRPAKHGDVLLLHAWDLCHIESVRVTGSRPTKGMPVLSAARQRGSNSGLGAATKGTPLCAVLSHCMPTPPRKRGHENWAQSCNSPIPPCGAWPADHIAQLQSLQKDLRKSTQAMP